MHSRVRTRPIVALAQNERRDKPRLVIKTESLQAILEEVAQVNARAKKVKPEELVDARYLEEMDKSGFFDQLWGKK